MREIACRHQGQLRRGGKSRTSPAAPGKPHDYASGFPAAHGCPWGSRYPSANQGGPHDGIGGSALKGSAAFGGEQM